MAIMLLVEEPAFRAVRERPMRLVCGRAQWGARKGSPRAAISACSECLKKLTVPDNITPNQYLKTKFVLHPSGARTRLKLLLSPGIQAKACEHNFHS